MELSVLPQQGFTQCKALPHFARWQVWKPDWDYRNLSTLVATALGLWFQDSMTYDLFDAQPRLWCVLLAPGLQVTVLRYPSLQLTVLLTGALRVVGVSLVSKCGALSQKLQR